MSDILVSRDVHPTYNRSITLVENETPHPCRVVLDARFRRLVCLRVTWSQACSNRVRGGCPRSVDAHHRVC